MSTYILGHITHAIKERFLQAYGPLGDLRFLSVVQDAVVDEKLDVASQVIGRLVLDIVELLLRSAEVHGAFDEVKVIRNVQGNWVDWEQEWRGILMFLQLTKNGATKLQLLPRHHFARRCRRRAPVWHC